ncbi:2-oxoglutarate dehydrogenase complex dihydrolipoyllysine-residue succinyltransferase [Catalinimonas sp. 4WD22]|uniref:2-oxoglutarate dehydrogenase complex dihydrolipoyllysine-residue succinyltransferase n=1 Tax=Catalinimonas locisalis TaxID=3133978 RepID=UPI0031014CEE
MSLEIKVPTVGESITEVTIAEWTKKDGDYVEMDEVIAELESDKATFELNAEQAGVLHIKTEAGETVEIGAVICEIDTSASGNGNNDSKAESESEEEAEGSASEAPAAENKKQEKTEQAEDSSQEAQSIEMKIPTVGESITEVTISEWLKEDGEQVEMDEVIAEIESDKATFELTAEAAGTLRIKAQAGETLEIGTLACVIETNGQGGTGTSQSQTSTEKEKTSAPADTNGKDNGRETYATGHASPAASKILAEKGIDPKQVKGTGVDGRITKEDAEKAEKTAPAQSKQATTEKPAKEEPKSTEAASTEDGNRQQRREKMSSLRKTVSRRLVAAKNETAMLTTFNEVDMKPVMELRKKYKEAFKEKYDVNLGFMSFFTKAACLALQEWPAVNAFIDGEELVYNDYCDVSIAVSSPKGLVVPVIRNAEAMAFDKIEKEVVRLAKKARDGKLSIDEMTGGTFTITNGGIFGSMLSTPIINQPQSAILGMHNIVERPVAIDGQVEIRPVMYVALSYDHRVIDGRESVSFLYRIKELIEDPSRLLLGI